MDIAAIGNGPIPARKYWCDTRINIEIVFRAHGYGAGSQIKECHAPWEGAPDAPAHEVFVAAHAYMRGQHDDFDAIISAKLRDRGASAPIGVAAVNAIFRKGKRHEIHQAI